MCGRYVSVSSPDLLAERFRVHEVRADDAPADYNVTPRTEVPAVREREGVRVLERLRWGLVPSWAKDPSVGDRLINARAESVAQKPAYKRAFATRRCILPADGFYEWKAVPGQKRKQPFFIARRDREPLAFAGLWEAWRDRADPDAPWIATCVIITTDANELLRPVHDRMPVVLPERAWDEWLDPGNRDVERLRRLLVPAPGEEFECYPVRPLVNRPGTNGPELVEPAPDDEVLVPPA